MFVKLMYNDNIFLRGAILLKLLEDRIVKDGIVKPGNVLKVDSFLNHQMDISLFNDMGKEFKRLFNDTPINKILTIEASGIGIACVAAQYFDNVPVVLQKNLKLLILTERFIPLKLNHLLIKGCMMLYFQRNIFLQKITSLLLMTF